MDSPRRGVQAPFAPSLISYLVGTQGRVQSVDTASVRRAEQGHTEEFKLSRLAGRRGGKLLSVNAMGLPTKQAAKNSTSNQ